MHGNLDFLFLARSGLAHSDGIPSANRHYRRLRWYNLINVCSALAFESRMHVATWECRCRLCMSKVKNIRGSWRCCYRNNIHDVSLLFIRNRICGCIILLFRSSFIGAVWVSFSSEKCRWLRPDKFLVDNQHQRYNITDDDDDDDDGDKRPKNVH